MKRYHILSDQQIEEIVSRRVEEEIAARVKDAEQDRLKSQIDMAVLQAQINPHFLYNTLECIRGQALAAGVSDIADTTHTLSRFFRYCVSSRSLAVPLRDELENVRNYMRIQQYRFRDRFTLEVFCGEAEDEALEGILPKLTLQPIVENAVVHGFGRIGANARIELSVVKTRRHLNILVRDNGEGMDRETLERVAGRLRCADAAAGQTPGDKGVGLPNVDRRLKLFFGPEYGLSVESARGVGTSVEIHIPYKV